MRDTENLLKQIKNRQFRAIKEDRKKQLLLVLQQYNLGLLVKEERDAKVREILYTGFPEISRCLGLQTMSYEQSESFLEDYRNWRKGDPIIGEWYHRDMQAEGFDLWPEDIIRCVDALYALDCFFKKIPSDIPDPRIYHIHTYQDRVIWGIDFESVEDDGGLFSQENPLGREFHITRSDGVQLHLNVMSFRKHGDPFAYRDHRAEEPVDLCYIGTGSVDDYYFWNNGKAGTDIRFEEWSEEGKLYASVTVSVQTEPGPQDGSPLVDTHFPRWEKYNQFVEKLQKEYADELEELVDALSTR